MAIRLHSVVFVMLAELRLALDTSGEYFPRKCEEPPETLSVTSKANSKLLDMRAELHYLAACMHQVHQNLYT